MRLLVVGANGLLGGEVTRVAAERGDDVHSGYIGPSPEAGTPVELDLLRPDTVARAICTVKPDVVIHTAAMTDVDGCERDRELARAVNVEGTATVADLAREAGAFLVYVSTDYVFSGEQGDYREGDATGPVNHYGLTKLEGERRCRDACIARPCVIYGARPALGKVNFALWLIDKLGKGEQVSIVTDQFVTPTLNTSLARMLLELGDRRLTGVFHTAGATRVSRFDFSRMLADEFGLDSDLINPITMDDIEWAARRPRDSSLNTDRVREILKEKPSTIEQALRLLKEEIEHA